MVDMGRLGAVEALRNADAAVLMQQSINNAIILFKFKSDQLLSLTVSPLRFLYAVRTQSMPDIGRYGI